MEYQKLKKMMSKFKKIILSVSLVSIIMSSLKLYFSAIPLIHLLGIALNKNCIFLICNGLLVFVAKTSDGSVLSSSGSDLNDLLQRKIGESLPPTLEAEEPSSLLIKDDEENEELKEEKEAEASKEEEKEDECLCEEEKKLKNLVMEDLEGDGGGENCKIEDVENKLLDGGGGENCNLQDENESEIGLLFEEEEEEEESMEMLSTEELNKKFEDFIRRTKEDIRMGRNNYNGKVNYNYDINLYDKNWPIIIVN